jgi:hypothetical protein
MRRFIADQVISHLSTMLVAVFGVCRSRAS